MKSIKTFFGIRGRAAREAREQAPDTDAHGRGQPIVRSISASSQSLNTEQRGPGHDFFDAQVLGNSVDQGSARNAVVRRPKSPDSYRDSSSSVGAVLMPEATSSSKPPIRPPLQHSASQRPLPRQSVSPSHTSDSHLLKSSNKTRRSNADRRVPVPTPTPTQTVRSAKESLSRQTSKSSVGMESQNVLAMAQPESSATTLTSSLILEVTGELPSERGRDAVVVRDIQSSERPSRISSKQENVVEVMDQGLAPTEPKSISNTGVQATLLSGPVYNDTKLSLQSRQSERAEKGPATMGGNTQQVVGGETRDELSTDRDPVNLLVPSNPNSTLSVEEFLSFGDRTQLDSLAPSKGSQPPHRGDGMPWYDDEDDAMDIPVVVMDNPLSRTTPKHSHTNSHHAKASDETSKIENVNIGNSSSLNQGNGLVAKGNARELQNQPRDTSTRATRPRRSQGSREHEKETESMLGARAAEHTDQDRNNEGSIRILKLPQNILSRSRSIQREAETSTPSSPLSPGNLAKNMEGLGAPSSPVSPPISHVRSERSTLLGSPSPRARIIQRNSSFDQIDHHQNASIRKAVNAAYGEALQEEARGPGGGLRRVIELLRQNEQNYLAVENIAIAIAVLSENDPVSSDAFGNYGAIEALLQCLVRYSENAKVCGRVVSAIRSLVTGSRRNAKLLEAFNGVQILTTTAKCTKIQEHSVIAVDALRTLAALMLESPLTDKINAQGSNTVSNASATRETLRRPNVQADNANLAVKKWEDAISKVTMALELHEHREQVQEAGLRAIRTLLAKTDPSKLENTILSEVIAAATDAYQLHGNSSMDICWQCLGLLCDVDDARDSQLMVELDVDCFFGSLLRVLSSTEAESDLATVEAGAQLVARALHATMYIGWRTKESCQNVVKAGAVEVVLETLRVFPGRRDVLEPVCGLARSILDSAEGQHLVDVKGQELALGVLGAIMAVTRA